MLLDFFVLYVTDWLVVQATDHKYQVHPIFGEMDRYVEFYDSLATAVFQFPTVGTKAICNIDSYVFSSIRETLRSIRDVLLAGRMNDAYSLLRKFYDSAIITIYSNLYLAEKVGVENMLVKQIDDWLAGRERIPEFRIMSQYIRTSAVVAPINILIYSDDRYRLIRNRCNDFTHYNFFQNVLLNDPDIHLPGRMEALEGFAADVLDVVILHASYLFFACQHYMVSSDYLDSLECGLVPEEDSQYWVAPFIQEFFDVVLVKNRPDLAGVIKTNTSMHLA